MFKKRENYITISKRGLSDVVTTLIIILISLVAIGLVWVVVQNVLQEGSEQVDLGEFTLDLQIKNVQIQGENVTVVVVKRNPGEGEFVGMDFIFSDGTKSEIIRKNVSLNELEQKSFTFELSQINLSNLKTVSVAPVYLLSSGKESTGSLADSFDIPANKSLGTSQNNQSGGTGTGAIISKFERLGFVGAGEETYTISGTPGIYPEFKSATVNPLDVHMGDNQTLTATVYSPYNITNVTTFTQLDNENLTLLLIKIVDNNAGTSTWQINWTVYDTHLETYRTTFFARDGIGNETTMTLTWTDACTDAIIPGSSTSTINLNCTISDIRGTDNGNIIVGQGNTVTLSTGAMLVYTTSLTKSAGARIVDSGGQIRKGYLYYFGSGTTATNATPVFGVNATAPGGFIRVKDTTSITNCTASSSLVGPCTASCSDTDGGIDHFTAGTATAYDGSCTNSGCSYTQSAEYCIDTIKLSEVYCSGNQIFSDGNVRCDQLYATNCIDATCGAP